MTQASVEGEEAADRLVAGEAGREDDPAVDRLGDRPSQGLHIAPGDEPDAHAATGTPKLNASMPMIPKGSCQRDGSTSARARR
jgi:hypothetical protein